MDGDQRELDDLTVRLEWPDDPLVHASEPPPADDSEQRVEALEQAVEDLPEPGSDVESLEAAVVRLEYIAAEIVQALRGMNDNLQRLAADNRSSIQKSMTRMESVVTAMQAQNGEFTRQVSGELKALRRRLPLRASAGETVDGADDLEELVARVADEVEIRVAAAVNKPSKPRSPRRASPR
jgi:hypothetical protein